MPIRKAAKPVETQTAGANIAVRRYRPSLLVRILCGWAGVNSERLATCPAEDRQAAVRTGLAMVLSFLFCATAVASGMCVAFGTAPLTLVAIIPVSLLIAGIIILVDHAMVQSHWLQTGLIASRARVRPRWPADVRFAQPLYDRGHKASRVRCGFRGNAACQTRLWRCWGPKAPPRRGFSAFPQAASSGQSALTKNTAGIP
jgi:hypothetical protein